MNSFSWLKRFLMRFGWATPNDLYSLGVQLVATIKDQSKIIMSAISDFAAKQSAFNDKLSTDLDALQTDVTNLNALVTQLQNSGGTISAEDQATLDQLQQAGQTLQDKADSLVATDTPVIPPAASTTP